DRCLLRLGLSQRRFELASLGWTGLRAFAAARRHGLALRVRALRPGTHRFETEASIGGPLSAGRRKFGLGAPQDLSRSTNHIETPRTTRRPSGPLIAEPSVTIAMMSSASFSS